MNETSSLEVLIAKFWTEATSKGLGNAWNNDFEEFDDQYYGYFKNLEDYAQYIIEEWDKSNFIPFQLSGRIKPSDLLNDEYYMREVHAFKGPSQNNPEEEVVYIFHTQEYTDRLDR